jgi:glutathione S-transferase
MKLLGRLSSINVRKVAWTLAELGLPFEREDWGMGARDPQTPGYLALNPNAQVPVLIDGDFVLWESNTIIRYLANAYGDDAFFPKEPHRRARIEQWIDWQATDLNAAWRVAFPALARGQKADPALVEASVKAWNQKIALLDAHLAQSGAFVAGDAFTLGDIPTALSLHRWLKTPMAHTPAPAAETYYERMRARPAFRPYALDDVP